MNTDIHLPICQPTIIRMHPAALVSPFFFTISISDKMKSGALLRSTIRSSKEDRQFLLQIPAVPVRKVRRYLVTDADSQEAAIQVLQDASGLSSVDILVDFLRIYDVLHPMQDIMQYMREYFSPDRSEYFSEALSLISLGLHRVFRSEMRVISLGIDLSLKSDISLLHRHFSLFGDAAVMGMAHEQQPVYRYILREYRKLNPGTKCGEAPGKGFPGFNSGVVLLDLGRIRSSTFYQSFLREQAVKKLTAKYFSSGHLGDQGFYTLLYCEHPELFYVLPCAWNRQLCQWWKDNGYGSVLNDYHNCTGEVHVYHYNCNLPIPGKHLED
ncbi:xyloside xylosyltransferase 1-like [Ornithodoros turicata]|uniref:xyloside xylosyltransferase 1-like n=1 Tax=Ornithodoros turicata TaxID=34597 RepID=UPI003139DD1C